MKSMAAPGALLWTTPDGVAESCGRVRGLSGNMTPPRAMWLRCWESGPAGGVTDVSVFSFSAAGFVLVAAACVCDDCCDGDCNVGDSVFMRFVGGPIVWLSRRRAISSANDPISFPVMSAYVVSFLS